ncbi:hypothetical protein CLU79DRAFT_705171 [Phycomyces nitens]|nr:hypothetical protein CLU79DRAFT_705171 [Phycomyces nitens]
MDSAYTNFLQAPNLVHAMAQPRNYADHLRWRFKNQGYAELDTGAFVPRSKVQSFLTQLGKSGMGKSRLRRADRYFSVWTNQYPWILENPLVSLQPYDAMRRMQRVLEDDRSLAPKDYFERFEDMPMPSHRDTRSACANDKCLFTTNMSPFPRPEDIEFTKESIPNLHHLDALYEDGGFDLPQKHYWNTHSFHMAVDMDPQTCWNTHKSPRAGDYFGLVMVGDIHVRELTVFSSQELKRPDKLFKVSVKEKGAEWVECGVMTTKKAPVSRNAVMKLNCPDMAIRAIKIAFEENQPEPFELCGIALDRFFI